MFVVRILDRFEIRPGMVGTAHQPGLVVVFDPAVAGVSVAPRAGTPILGQTPSGDRFTAAVGEVKRHGPGMSFFLPRLTAADVPLGSTLEWETAPAPATVAVGR